MHCASCSRQIESVLRELTGVSFASIHYASGRGKVTFDDAEIGIRKIIETVDSLGYRAREKGHTEIRRPWHHLLLLLQLLVSGFGAAILFGSMISMSLFGQELSLLWQSMIALIVQAFGGWELYKNALLALRSRVLTMDVLIVLGTTIALVYSALVWMLGLPDHTYFETSAVIIALVLLGRFFEARSKQKARSGMESLIQMQPKFARIVERGSEKEIAIEELAIGQVVLVRKGDQIPVDGRVFEGQSFVNEAMMTGESAYVLKKKGDSVIGGTINMEQPLYVLCEAKGDESVLGRMIALVEKAEGTKLPVQRIIDKVSAIFIPLVIGIALVTFCLWLFVGRDPHQGLQAMISVLIISCPCALGLATPVVIMVSIHRAAQLGILIKDFQALEIVGKMEHMVLDKTGTVTLGEMRLIEEPAHATSSEYAKNLARFSSHPLARAIAGGELSVQHIEETPGMGIAGVIGGERVLLGSEEYLEQNGVRTEKDTKSFSAVFVSREGHFSGVFLFEDPVKQDALTAIERLKQLKITTHLVSGDRASVVERVAGEIHVDHYAAEVSPSAKGEYVKALKGITAMVGDGVNDAPALASASIGIAMGSGADVAMEAASIGIIGRKLSLLPDLVELGRATRTRLWQNIFYAFGYNAIAIPLAAFGYLNPMIAAVAMALSSFSVVMNALRK